MEVKNLCDTVTKQEIIERIRKLAPESRAQWGKMNVAQMLAHLQMPIGVALGDHKLPNSLFGKLLGRFFRHKLYDDKPYKHGLPTAPSFKMTTQKNFEEEKNRAIEMVSRFSDQNIINTRHPFFGKMTREQWGKANWKHLDHHLQQFGV
jgi:hypothetical protein